MPRARPGTPLGLADVADAFDRAFRGEPHVVLAVSGGPDSMALMHLAAMWLQARERRRGTPGLSVVTVDHGLRPESHSEAEAVAAAAGVLGLSHHTLRWTGAKPGAGLQAAAREARYGLIGAYMEAHGWRVLATGHTADDQAETLLMRLARGSGVDGLAAMRESMWRGPVRIVRPLLGIEKARLLSWLAAHDLTWCEDPGNAAPAFERGRWRTLRSDLDALGLTTRQLTTSARRLARASAALQATAQLAVDQAGGALAIDAFGYVRVSWPWLISLPEEVRLRVLRGLIAWVGGGPGPVSLGHLEALTVDRGWVSPAGRTLAGAAFAVGADGFVVLTREPGRGQLPAVPLQPGQTLRWDGRFSVSANQQPGSGRTVAALGAAGLSWLVRVAGLRRPPAPARALRALPAIWDRERLVAAPLLGYSDPAEGGRAVFTTVALPFSLS